MTKNNGVTLTFKSNKYLQILILYQFKNIKKRDMIYKKSGETKMKKIIAILLCAVFIYTGFLTSCENKPEETSSQTIETPTDTAVTDQDTANPETETETETETDEETEAEPASPYGMFTYSDNPINATSKSPYAILIDAKTKEILYLNCEPDEKLYPASTTKLLTAIVALKYCDPDVKFKPGDELTLLPSDSSIAYIKTNHELTLDMLIEGMMLPSGGDAAYTVAAGVGRIIAKDDTLSGIDATKVFVDEMNRYGKEVLGLQNSHFTCPDGYHDDDHYTTIIDIMTVAYAAMSEPIIMKYAGLEHDDVRYASGHTNSWNNSNKLIDPDSPYYYENATGLKTGTTEEAGYCLISTAALGPKTVLAGVFGAKDARERFTDSRELLVLGINR